MTPIPLQSEADLFGISVQPNTSSPPSIINRHRPLTISTQAPNPQQNPLYSLSTTSPYFQNTPFALSSILHPSTYPPTYLLPYLPSSTPTTIFPSHSSLSTTNPCTQNTPSALFPILHSSTYLPACLPTYLPTFPPPHPSQYLYPTSFKYHTPSQPIQPNPCSSIASISASITDWYYVGEAVDWPAKRTGRRDS